MKLPDDRGEQRRPLSISDLSGEEQAAIDAAQHDGNGWALGDGLPVALIERLAELRVARWWKGRWKLTPEGFAHTARFRAAP